MLTTAGYAQQRKIDALRLQLRKDSAYIFRPRRLKMLLSLDQRNTFLETSGNVNTPVDLGGIKAGVTVFNQHKTGVGYYSIRNSTVRISQAGSQPLTIGFKFSYFTVFYEYYFIHTRTWDVGIPFEVGLGSYRTIGQVAQHHGTVIPLGTAIDVHFKPMRWFSFNGMGGYRQVVNNFSPVKLSNWFYAVGFSLNTRHIYDDARYYFKKVSYKRKVSAARKGGR